MTDVKVDPRAAELLRRRAEKNGHPTAPGPAPTAPAPATAGPARRLSDDDRASLRAVAAENPTWSASELADAFEAGQGWRPSYQAIGRALADPATPGPRKPARESSPAVVDPEIAAMAAIASGLAGLDPPTIVRVLDWARARFQREGRSA